MNYHRLSYLSFVLFIGVILITSCNAPENKQNLLLEEITKDRVMLPNGWALTPVGKQLPLGDLPLNIAVSNDQKYAAVTNNGQSTQSVMLFDVQNQKMLDEVEIRRAWLGLTFNAAASHLYVSGGNENLIWKYAVSDTALSLEDSIVLGLPWPSGGWTEAGEGGDKISAAGITINKEETRLFTVTKEDSMLYVCSLEDNSVVKTTKLPAAAYTCILEPNEDILYISVWGAGQIACYNTLKDEIEDFIKVGSHPNDMKMTEDGKYLFVANGNSNTVSVIDTESRKVIETLDVALYPDAPTGSTPNSLAISEDERLYVANADNNCLAVFNIEQPGQSRPLGFIPTAWYPTAVQSIGGKIWVANGKGASSLANPKGPNPGVSRTPETEYIGALFKGTLSIFDEPEGDTLRTYTVAVQENTPYKGKEGREMPAPFALGKESPIKHVFYIIKENRTYDQVFGDIEKGNGDPSLCLFPDSITPNQHALAREFVLLDNFYVKAEVSADGHNWTTAAYANDYIEKTWPTLYSSRGGTYDYEGGGKTIAYPDEGFIWDYCQRNGISYRTYGEFGAFGEANIPVLEGHVSTTYPGYNLSIKDIERAELWKAEFDSLIAADAVPQFNTVRFGNDHTAGARVGMPTPAAMVADNDLAVGMFVEHLSKSPIWEKSAVFVLEDDAQNGPDHIDAHRSIALVISPYTKRKEVVSEMYSTASMLHTIELLLGLPPMSQYDAAATPMWACFQAEPDLTPYQALPNQIDLDELNVAQNELSMLSASFNLDVEDAAPDIPFNQVIWRTVRGIDTEMPAPRRSAFVFTMEEDEEDEEEGE